MSLSSYSSTPLSRRSSEFSIQIPDESSPLLDNAMKTVELILSNQAKATSYLASQYRNSQWSINQIKKSLKILNNSLDLGGKIIISGMGKSYKIATKTVATLNSLGVHSAILHPSEALHGDLGIVREDHNDAMIIISASGNSPELTAMLEHIPITIPIVLMSCNKKSQLSEHAKVSSMLYSELPTNLSEKNLYGLSAPTISTTLCLTLLDAVSIALSELYINDINTRRSMFGERHPGGAIGLKYRNEKLGFKNMKFNNSNKKEIERIDNQEIEGNEDVDIDDLALEMSDLVLLGSIKLSKNKITMPKLPEEESEILKIITLYDYVLVGGYASESNKILDCKLVRQIYRDFRNEEDSWDEILWKIKESLVDMSL